MKTLTRSQEWPKSNILSAGTIYKQLFEGSLENRLHILIRQEAEAVQVELLVKAANAGSLEAPLFGNQRRGAKKFNSSAATGVPLDLSR